MGSCLTNKYAEGLPGKRYYGGCQVVDEVETLAIDRAKKLFGAIWANVQPHSGAQANASVMMAVMDPGDTFLGLDLSHGGHLTHGSPVNYSGLLYKPVAYKLNEKDGRVDYDMMEVLAKKEKPKMIVAGASAYSRDWDFARMRSIADSVGAVLMADIAHPAGLIATKLLNNPFPHCHIVTTTTHKTLRGPRGGLILVANDFENWWGRTNPKGEVKTITQLLDSAVFPGIQGGPLEHVIAGKAVAFGEALTESYSTYMKQVKLNAVKMADRFIEKGYHVVSGGTDNHLFLIDLSNKNSMLIDLRTKVPDITGKQVENILQQADITVNKNMVPFDSRSPFQTSGIRVGTPAITTRGVKEDIIIQMDEVIMHIDNEPIIKEVRAKVNQLMHDYPLFAY